MVRVVNIRKIYHLIKTEHNTRQKKLCSSVTFVLCWFQRVYFVYNDVGTNKCHVYWSVDYLSTLKGMPLDRGNSNHFPGVLRVEVFSKYELLAVVRLTTKWLPMSSIEPSYSQTDYINHSQNDYISNQFGVKFTASITVKSTTSVISLLSNLLHQP